MMVLLFVDVTNLLENLNARVLKINQAVNIIIIVISLVFTLSLLENETQKGSDRKNIKPRDRMVRIKIVSIKMGHSVFRLCLVISPNPICLLN